jgi:hypothetical protein
MPSRVFVTGIAYDFLRWQDGNTEPTRTLNLTLDLTITAFYEKVPTYLLSVNSKPFSVPFTIDGVSGYVTPYILRGLRGSYIISFPSEVVYNGQRFTFKVWENGSTNPTRTINFTSNMSIIAYYIAYVLTVNSTPITGVPVTINQVPIGKTPVSVIAGEGACIISVPQEVET